MGLCPARVSSAHLRGQQTAHGHAERVPPRCLAVLWLQDCVWSAWGAGQKFQGVTAHKKTTTSKEKELVHNISASRLLVGHFWGGLCRVT